MNRRQVTSQPLRVYREGMKTITASEPTVGAARLWQRPHGTYLAIAFGYSWVLWIAAWIAAGQAGVGQPLLNEGFVWPVLFDGPLPGGLLLPSLVALAAVYGPMLGGMIASRRDPSIPSGSLMRQVLKVNVGGREYGRVVLILLIVSLPALILTVATVDGSGRALSQVAMFLLVFFAVQFLTSGTEEIGWRGYLTRVLLPGRDFWSVGWIVGPIWALWHLPVVLMIFLAQGMVIVQIVPSLVGFGIGIVAMAILQAWFYERTRSVFLAMFIHALFNTLPLTIILLWEGSPAAVVSNVLLWVVVIVVRRRSQRPALVPPAVPSQD